MKCIRVILFATACVVVSALAASAQSGNVTQEGAAAVSPATHCRNAQGQVQLKTTGSLAGGLATTGSAAGPSGSKGATGTAASSAPGGSVSGSPVVAANLPPC